MAAASDRSALKSRHADHTHHARDAEDHDELDDTESQLDHAGRRKDASKTLQRIQPREVEGKPLR